MWVVPMKKCPDLPWQCQTAYFAVAINSALELLVPQGARVHILPVAAGGGCEEDTENEMTMLTPTERGLADYIQNLGVERMEWPTSPDLNPNEQLRRAVRARVANTTT